MGKILSTESLYVVTRFGKYNIAAIAYTDDEKKIASSMYITRDDLYKLYRAYEKAQENEHTLFETNLSKGVFKLTRGYRNLNTPNGKEKIQIYQIIIGQFKSNMSVQSYNEFIYTLRDVYAQATSGSKKSKITNIKTFLKERGKKMSKKKKKGIFE